MSLITAIATATPDNKFTQSVIADFMLRKMTLHNGDSRKLKTIFKLSGISYRHSVLSDYGKSDNFEFYPEDGNAIFPTTQNRLDTFRAQALPLSLLAIEKLWTSATVSAKEITHLIVVSCTGMYAPGLDIDIVQHAALNTTVHRTAITFMGCYAAFNALKIGDAFCKSNPKAKVLIVCTELCSIHFQRGASEDNLIANALFADGSAALIMESETTSKLQLEVEGFHSDLAPKGSNDMAWNIGDFGFEMKLSAYVPDIIQGGIAALTQTLLRSLSISFSDIKHFAIHPGGKKILEAIEKELGITKEQNRAAYHVLENYGNMSSPTVLFVLEELINRLARNNKGENILSFAFGPGLTLESMILKINSI
ncbi:type III polyketide synthase [Chryseosolibacter indicus]|uniref:Type III polyketide synthase n=1 Tax=Chryseosolibacter indicus TaxID=2782351 RepID=A0ABS5VRZ4_9BACT|nr:type III polyketide synthase [Chryseosolibacter indicus]MBT1704220.1 type III polyketide synthase [Chryseosolibacter indicus]